MKEIEKAFFILLAECDAVYGRSRSDSEIAVAANTFARVLRGLLDCPDWKEVLENAFSQHHMNSRFYPVPHDIAPYLEEARYKRRLRKATNAPFPEGRCNPEIPELVWKSLQGDEQAKGRLAEIRKAIKQAEA